MNVGVAPSTGPLVPCWTVRLWASGELFVKLIVTVPALAVSVLLVNFNAPEGSAAIASALLAPAAVLDGVDVDVDADVDAGVLDVADELAGVELAAALLLLLLLLEPPPHALIPSTRAETASVSRSVVGTGHISLLFDQLTR